MADEGKSKKTSAADAVFEALRSQISSGVWKVGDRLPSEGELAERYGVNRLTVRVALQKLNALGVVETRAGAGTHVIEFDFENYLRMASKFYGRGDMLQEVTEFRNHLEIECARLACERATDEDLAELERKDADHQKRWDRIWGALLCKRYQRQDHPDFWLWNQAFFEAPISDLQSIARLVGATVKRKETHYV